MITKSRLLREVGFLLTFAILIPAGAFVFAATGNTSVERLALAPAKPQRPISLRDRLVVGLGARLKSEVAFVELVVAQVHAGHLPQRLVDETYFWSRSRASVRRNGRTRRPIVYFQPAMAARVKRLGVEL